MDIKSNIDTEKARLSALLEDVSISDKRRAALEAVIENLAFMRVKLDSTVSEIAEDGLSIAYDNGGGQTGIRENPAYKAYVNLWKSYLAGIEKVIAALPASEQNEAAQNGDNVLQMILDRQRDIS